MVTMAARSLRRLFIGRIKRALVLVVGGMRASAGMVPRERLDDRNQVAWNQQQIVIEDSDDLEQGVETRNHLAGLDARDVRLGQPDSPPQFGLAPSPLVAGIN
jgi:hypothetical protein